MSVGPQLPPHLQKQRDEERLQGSDSDSDEDVGPRLPSVACRGPKPAEDNKEDESSSDDDYGPALPPGLANRSGGPSSTRESAPNNPPADDSDSEDDAIGPRIPQPSERLSLLQQQEALDIERRAKSMKEKIEGKDNQVVQRETWMLELPEAKRKNFGLGPRQFSRKGITEVGDRSGWTQTPEEKAKRARGEVPEDDGPTEEEEKERTEYLINKARDEAMEKVTTELKKKRGSESLLEKHEKERKKKSKKDKKDPQERRPFDRDADLGVNKFDDAQRKLMIKKAGQMDSRFSAGQQKYL